MSDGQRSKRSPRKARRFQAAVRGAGDSDRGFAARMPESLLSSVEWDELACSRAGTSRMAARSPIVLEFDPIELDALDQELEERSL